MYRCRVNIGILKCMHIIENETIFSSDNNVSWKNLILYGGYLNQHCTYQKFTKSININLIFKIKCRCCIREYKVINLYTNGMKKMFGSNFNCNNTILWIVFRVDFMV